VRHGESLRLSVLDAKKSGQNTEAAFCKALNIPGDPFEALLNIF
jgi:hypothetical protein